MTIETDRQKLRRALLAAVLLGFPAAASAQQTTSPDQSQRIEQLEAQVEQLQKAIDELKTGQAKATPTWKGAPELSDKATGFSFKPKGFVQFDAGHVGFPDGEELAGTVGGLNYDNLGFNARARRLVLGAEGTLAGGFGYKAEFNFAQGSLDYEDIILFHDLKSAPVRLQVGNFYPYSGLEIATSSRLGSMLERASFTEAFNFSRRLGIGAEWIDREDDSYLFQAGLFSQPINDASFNRTGWQAAARGVYSPRLSGKTRLHLGASFQYRVNQRDSQNAQYRSRPLTQTTDQRFVDTGRIASDGDDILGVELGLVHKSLHIAAEGQKLWVRGHRPGRRFGPNDGAGGGLFYDGDPGFTGGYLELGYYLTGESRGYKGGKWDRTKVLKPFDQGGWGSLQLNGRVDYLELRDRLADGPVLAPFHVNGGRQLGLQASLIWNPTDYVRFMAQYGRVRVTGGPRALAIDPASSEPANEADFSVDTAAVRAQLEF